MKSPLPLNEKLPGIVALFAYSPATAAPMSRLAEVLLHNPANISSLTCGERELIAAFVSKINGTEFCYLSHKAFAEAQFKKEENTIDVSAILSGEVKFDDNIRLSLIITVASFTVTDPRLVLTIINKIKKEHPNTLSDIEFHDIVLIASAFCMYNRYVTALAAPLPENEEDYKAMAERIVAHGYENSSPKNEPIASAFPMEIADEIV